MRAACRRPAGARRRARRTGDFHALPRFPKIHLAERCIWGAVQTVYHAAHACTTAAAADAIAAITMTIVSRFSCRESFALS
jgi:hypothetical protein